MLELIEALGPDYVTAVACEAESAEFVRMVRESGVELFAIDMPRLRSASLLPFARGVRGLVCLIREFKPDIIHSNTVRAHILSAVAGRLTGVKVIWHIRDFTFPLPLYRLLCRMADRIVYLSKAIERVHGHKPGRTSVILNGTVPPIIDVQAERDRIRKEFAIAQETPVAVIVGRIYQGKGQDQFLRAAAVVKERITKAVFMLVGTGDEAYTQSLRQLAVDLGIAESTVFTGYHSDPVSFMCAADLVVQASVEPEGLARVLIEAMSIGRPTVGSVFGAPCEVIDDGVTGLLVNPTDTAKLADAMASVLSDAELSARLSQNAKRRFEEFFNQTRETQETITVYNSLLNG